MGFMKAIGCSLVVACIGGFFSTVTADEIPPSIITSPVSLNRPAGQDATFNVMADGTPPLRYQWYFNSNAIPAATNASLVLLNVQTNNAGQYYVSVTNDFGGTNSGNVTLTVSASAPFFIQQPTGMSTWPGSSVSVSATFYGSTPMYYQWRLNGTNLLNATNAVLSFPNIQFANGGGYTLFLSNAIGTRLSSPALLSVAELAAWGAGTVIVGGTNSGQSLPPHGLSNLLSVAGGSLHSLALKPDGRVIAWGYNAQGQTNINAAATNIAAIACGWGHNLALRSNGTLVAWGYNLNGQATISSASTNIESIAAGGYHNVVVRSNGTVIAWGLNTSGQTNVPAGLSNVVAVAAGLNHSLALKADGTVLGWGANGSGQTNTPAGLSNVVAISAGASNNLALLLNGTVVGWGANDYGQGAATEGLSNVIAIAAGAQHNVALREDGSIVAWGLNNLNQTSVPSGLPLTAGVAAGGSHSLALLGGNVPRFVRPPLDHIGYADYPAYLNAAAVSAVPLAYQWMRAGTNVPGGTNATLLYATAQSTDAGIYHLVVTNSFGALTSAPAMLTILPSQPNFLAQPTNLIAVLGSNATFTAALSSPWATTYQWLFNGTNLPNATNVSLTISNVQLPHEGYYTLVASNLNGITTSSNANLDVVTLPEALDATNLDWSTSGTVLWRPTGSPAYTAPAAGMCGSLSNGQSGSLQTTIVGPGTLSFRWQTASPATLTFLLDGNTQFSQGILSWQPRTYYLSAGAHNLIWTAANNNSFGAGSAYLDAVSFVSGPTPATITSQPASRSIPAGTNLTLSLSAIGTPPLYYQWQFNGTNLPNTGATLTLTDAQAEMTGTYSVSVSNAYGGQTSSNVTITVTPSAPVFQTQPDSQQQLVGGQVSFAASATGTKPLFFQWRFNGADLPGATNSSLLLANVQPAQAGNYTIAASNSVNAVVSTNANLFVYQLPELGDALGNADLTWSTSSNSPWFPQTNITHDGVSAAQSGQLPGTDQASILTATAVGPATLTFWWKVSCDSFWSSLSFAMNGVGQSSITGEADWQQPQSYLLGPGTNTLQWTLTRGFGGELTDRGWLDEVVITPGWTAVSLLTQPINATASAGNNATFSASASGTPPLRYQWQFDGANISNATNATLTLFNVQTNNIGAYSVIVSNDFSMAASSNALLAVTPSGPVFTVQPGNRHLAYNGTTRFAASARGSAPLIYRWLFNSNAIPNATNSSLVVSNLQPIHTGAYSVIVSNEYNTVTSSNAMLTLERMVVMDYTIDSPFGTTAPVRPTLPGLTNLIAVAAGNAFSVALRDNGTVVAWGDNTYGQTNVPANLNDVIAIAAGATHALALRADGTVAAWGDNTYGQTIVPPGLTGVTAITCAESLNLALKSDRTVVAWGYNSFGQLNVPTWLTNVVSIAASYYNAAAVRMDGSVVMWGYYPTPVALFNAAVAAAPASFRNWFLYQDGLVTENAPIAYQNWTNMAVLGAASPGNLQSYVAGIRYDGTMAANFGNFAFPTSIYDLPRNSVSLSLNFKHLLVIANDGSPFLSQPLHDRSVRVEDSTIFASGVVAASPVFHQWQFNGSNLAGQTNNLLVITNTPLTAEGSYRCIVSNALGSMTTPSATLQVIRSTPRISPANSYVGPNGEFNLTLSGLSGHGDILLHASTNLIDWHPILTNPPVLGTLQLIDTNTPGYPHKFYRVEEK
jgi:alpha-tubulin suppressor-like RCC1 family protein